MIASFLVFLLGFTLIGVSSYLLSRGTKHDYYLASASIKPWLVGLSAVATNNSGYMFIGVIGYTYVAGFSAFWLMFGWILGDFLASLYVHRRLREATEHSGEVSYAGVLSHWAGQPGGALQRLIGLISLVFLLTYASAQLVAGSKALHVLFDWPLWAGAVMGAVIVVLYCLAGGIRASIWTDAAQSMVMIVAMSVLLVVATLSLGGIDGTWTEMRAIEGFTHWFPDDAAIPGATGAVLFAVGWLFAGLSVIGQPHVMVRFMTLDDHRRMRAARVWYYLWFTLFYAAATGVGLLSRVYLADTANFDAELALPTMAMELLPPVLVGLVLAGVFAATMSTADSLVLSCSATITHDLSPRPIERTALLKASTLLITAVALGFALLNNQSVFSLVIMAWSGLASAFGPLLLVLCMGLRPGRALSIAAIIVGFLVALGWRLAQWHEAVYEGMPGILAGLAVLLVGHALTKRDTRRSDSNSTQSPAPTASATSGTTSTASPCARSTARTPPNTTTTTPVV